MIVASAVVAFTSAECANQIYNFPQNTDIKCFKCPVDESIIRLPHPTTCSMYLICQDGKVSIHTCPGGLHFNPIIEQCDWPKGCVSHSNNVGTQPDIPKRDEENKSTPAAIQCIGTCPITDPKDRTIHLPTNDCTKFCACSNGLGIIMNCPPGLHFDKKLEICNYPRSAKCQSK